MWCYCRACNELENFLVKRNALFEKYHDTKSTPERINFGSRGTIVFV